MPYATPPGCADRVRPDGDRRGRASSNHRTAGHGRSARRLVLPATHALMVRTWRRRVLRERPIAVTDAKGVRIRGGVFCFVLRHRVWHYVPRPRPGRSPDALQVLDGGDELAEGVLGVAEQQNGPGVEQELDRASRSTDPRVRSALRLTDTFGLAELLAHGPKLARDWQNGWRTGGLVDWWTGGLVDIRVALPLSRRRSRSTAAAPGSATRSGRAARRTGRALPRRSRRRNPAPNDATS
jgi:hypothetical protein